MQPIDYSIDVKNPFESAIKGYQIGTTIQQMQAQKEQQAQQQQMLRSLLSKPNPTAEDYANATLAIPGMREQFKQAWDMHSAEQQTNLLSEVSQVHAALSNGKPQYAIDLLNQRATALENSGAPQSQITAARDMAKLIEMNPQMAQGAVRAKLMAIPGGDKVISSMIAYGQEQRAAEKAPYELTKAKAEAKVKGVEAENAEDKAVLALEKAADDIVDQREQRRIKAMEVALSRETNDLKRQELQAKLDEAKTSRDQKVRDRVSEAESSLANFDRSINTITELLNHPGFSKAAGWQGGFPTAPGTDAKDFEGLLETLQSQSFMAEVEKMKGLGALSENEGKKLSAAVANLDIKQSEKSLRKNLETALNLFRMGRERAVQKYGIAGTPTAEGDFVFPNHPKYGNVTTRKAQQLAARVGLTMDEVQQFLKDSAGGTSGASGDW